MEGIEIVQSFLFVRKYLHFRVNFVLVDRPMQCFETKPEREHIILDRDGAILRMNINEPFESTPRALGSVLRNSCTYAWVRSREPTLPLEGA